MFVNLYGNHWSSSSNHWPLNSMSLLLLLHFGSWSGSLNPSCSEDLEDDYNHPCGLHGRR